MRLTVIPAFATLLVASALVVSTLVFSSRAGHAADVFKVVKSARADMDGDGKKDAVRLEQSRNEEGPFRLTVNRAQVVENLEGEAEDFSIIDIHRARRGREIVVRALEPGSMGTYEYMLFRFDGRHVRKMALLGGEDATLRAPGDGTVRFKRYVDGFWQNEEKYVLRANHRLVLAAKPFYTVNVPATVRDSLTLYARRSTRRVSVKLRAGHKVRILQGDLKGWYLVRAASGARGWVQSDQIISHLDGLHIIG